MIDIESFDLYYVGMAKTYHPGRGAKWANRMLSAQLRKGRGPRFMRLLTVIGRRTGQPHSTPVVPVEADGERWVVAPFGEADWVRNVRAAGRLTLRRGEVSDTFTATEVEPAEAVPVLRRYLAIKPAGRFVKAYFDITPESPDDAIAAEAPRHPVFALRPLPH
jgi:deazaflavin-dependent oxidoreductase (nitroreductase family)